VAGKILNYYKNLFSVNGFQKVQLFFATHSEYVIRAALDRPDENLVIALKDENRVITYKRIDSPTTLPSITSAETNYLTFDIVSNDYHIELYGYLQGKNCHSSVKACDEYIKSQPEYDLKIHKKYTAMEIHDTRHCQRLSETLLIIPS
jgi:hypothetical protein